MDIGIDGVGNEVAIGGGGEELLVGGGAEHGGSDALVPVSECRFICEGSGIFGNGERFVGGCVIVGDGLKEGLEFGLSGGG